MKKTKIKPWGNKIQLELPTTKVGAMVIQEGASVIEKATVVALGPAVQSLSKDDLGKDILVKAWDIDIITLGDEKFYFVSDDSRAICATVM